jgi:outer membrane protein assembly factor BamB
MDTSRGYRSGPYMAVKTDGSGEILWRQPTGAPYVSSVLHYDGIVYMATETGVGSAIDAATGNTLWKQRLGGYFSASPVLAEGRVYMVNEEGETFVIKAGREYQLLSKNDLGERTLASPALADGRIILRTDEHLVCIAEQ